MDKDSKLIFENYQNSQLLNESFWRRLLRGSKIIFPKGTAAQVDNILQNAVQKITRTAIRNPNFFTDLNRELSENVVGVVQTLVAPAKRANDVETLGYLKTIALRFNEAIAKFDDVGKELTKINRSNLDSLIKSTEDSLDDTKELFEGYANSKTINPTFSEQSKEAINYINELQNSLKDCSKALGDKGLTGRAWEAIRTHYILSTLVALVGAGAIGAGEPLGYSIVSLLKYIVNAISSFLADTGKGGAEAMRSGEEPLTKSATLAPKEEPKTTSSAASSNPSKEEVQAALLGLLPASPTQK
jgi:hypothetical protein